MNHSRTRITASDAAKLFVGARLTLARQLAGLRKTALAERVDKTPTAVAAYESGRIRPSAKTVAEMCLALGVDPVFFLPAAGTAASPVTITPNFRSLRSTTQLVRDQATAYGQLVLDVLAVFERHVEMPNVRIPAYHGGIDSQSESSDPFEAASLVRKEWDLGLEPIKHLLRLCESRGMACVFSPYAVASVDAYSFDSKSRPLIVLNPLKGDYYRQRFDLAHELGHLVLHTDVEAGNQAVETQAHRFAAELLMPRDVIESQLPRRPLWPRLLVLKEQWGVSLQALLYRGRDLNIYSDSMYRNAMTHMSREGWRRQEPGARPSVEEPSLLPKALQLLEAAGTGALELAAEARVPMNVFRVITARTLSDVYGEDLPRHVWQSEQPPQPRSLLEEVPVRGQ